MSTRACARCHRPIGIQHEICADCKTCERDGHKLTSRVCPACRGEGYYTSAYWDHYTCEVCSGFKKILCCYICKRIDSGIRHGEFMYHGDTTPSGYYNMARIPSKRRSYHNHLSPPSNKLASNKRKSLVASFRFVYDAIRSKSKKLV